MFDSEYANKIADGLKKAGKDKCPKCKQPLLFRISVRGFVCKNRKCENFWNFGKGEVFSTLDSKVFNRLYQKPRGSRMKEEC